MKKHKWQILIDRGYVYRIKDSGEIVKIPVLAYTEFEDRIIVKTADDGFLLFKGLKIFKRDRAAYSISAKALIQAHKVKRPEEIDKYIRDIKESIREKEFRIEVWQREKAELATNLLNNKSLVYEEEKCVKAYHITEHHTSGTSPFTPFFVDLDKIFFPDI